MNPEDLARVQIDQLLLYAGWEVQDRARMNLFGRPGRGVALREAVMTTGEADYLLLVDGRAVGVIEAKRAGHTLSQVEEQSGRYAVGMPPGIKAWLPDRPLPFRYESTGVETFFTNGLDPEPRSRRVFAFHSPTGTYDTLNRRCPVEVGDILYTVVGSYGVAVPCENT